MTTALWLMLVQGVIGAFDTLYFHEYRARLVAQPSARKELWLHATRDGIYGILFATLPWCDWRGAWAWVLVALVAAEIGITIADFIVEDSARAPLGGVYPVERATHTVMAIIYGAMLAHLAPSVWEWSTLSTGFTTGERALPVAAQYAFAMMAAGVLLSGARDAYAALGLPNGAWPWLKASTVRA